MILRQFLHSEPVAASYIFGCGGRSAAMAVDPVGELQPYLDVLAKTGMQLFFVVDTHLHADHVSSARPLAEATGAQYVLFQEAHVAFSFHGVKDNQVLELGNVTATFWHTPGHTPEHISLLVTDKTRSTKPWAILTGHTLMVGDLGRTELATNAEEGARALYRSAQKLKSLPDYVEVYPGAYSGSMCGRGLSGKPSSTIGFERRFNASLLIENENEFVQFMLKDVPPAPPNAAEVRARNSGLLAAAAE
jgi:hydroxyacylglutathione hydrolase